MNILGIFGGYYNPAACLIIDGVLEAFIEEEKLTRKKMEAHIYPIKSVKWALKHSGLSMKDVDRIAFPWHPWRNLTHIPIIGLKEFCKKILSPSQKNKIKIQSKVPTGLYLIRSEWLHHMGRKYFSYLLCTTPKHNSESIWAMR